LSHSANQGNNPGFSVGVCAAETTRGVGELLRTISQDAASSDVRLRSVIFVVSGCRQTEVEELRGMARANPVLDLVVEDKRQGKAEAVNKILERSKGEYVVFVNSDAHPEPGAIADLVRTISTEEKVGVVSAKPVPRAGTGLSSELTNFMWEAHNECSLALNHQNISNHSSDELMAVRRKAVRRLPRGVVNDGAFLAGTSRKLGFTVRFSARARVGIETPSRVVDIIRQRRRILFGHAQVWKKTGAAPKTVESLLMLDPLSGLKILSRTISRRPKYILVLPLAAVSEAVAAFLSIWDSLVGSDRHIIWRRYS
jgi:poly-beta-1,6-N-acetyl-D-glucosamine synthase